MKTRGAWQLTPAGLARAALEAKRAEAAALELLWRACRQRDLEKLTAVLRDQAAELKGAGHAGL